MFEIVDEEEINLLEKATALKERNGLSFFCKTAFCCRLIVVRRGFPFLKYVVC